MSRSNCRPVDAEVLQDVLGEKTDPLLGRAVRDFLRQKGLEPNKGVHYYADALPLLAEGVQGGLLALGVDMEHPSTKDTPLRWARMMIGELTIGLNYEFFPKCTTTPNDQYYDQVVMVTHLETLSLCEHHLQTVHGYTHIGYIPGAKVLGLSKFARVTDFFARRPQIQERMTEQIWAALSFILGTEDVAVVQRCTHFCMKARGVRQKDAMTTTDKMGGRFLSNPALRQEFLAGILSAK